MSGTRAANTIPGPGRLGRPGWGGWRGGWTPVLLGLGVVLAVLAGAPGGLGVLDGGVQAAEGKPAKPETREVKAPSEKVFKAYGAAMEMIEAERYGEAMTRTMAPMTEGAVEPHEAALLYRVAAQIESLRDRLPQALDYLGRALASGGLEDWEVLEIRYNIGLLNLGLERYDAAIGHLEFFVRTAESPSAMAHYVLGSAYAAKDRWRAAAVQADAALAKEKTPRESFYNLAAAAYQQLEDYPVLVGILERAVTHFPNNKPFWSQLAAGYQTLDREQDAYAAHSAMHAQGLLTKSKEIEMLVDLHRYHGVPYKAARVMEAEMAAGRAQKSKENWQRLGEAWLAARDYKKARAALIQAADRASKGDLDYRVATAFAEEEAWTQANRYLIRALDKGGLKTDAANAWLLLGHARYNLGNRQGAIEAFDKAAGYTQSEDDATSWVEFITAQIEAEQAAAARDVVEASLAALGEAAAAAMRAARTAQYALDTVSAILEADADTEPGLRTEAAAALAETGGALEAARAADTDAAEKVAAARKAATRDQRKQYEPVVADGRARVEAHMTLAEDKFATARQLALELGVPVELAADPPAAAQDRG